MAAAALLLLLNTMAQNNSNANANANANDDVKPTIFHDFLGRGCAPVAKCATAGDVSSSSASASFAGGPISTTSDLGSGDRQVASHLEGVPFYGQRSDFSGSEIDLQYSGSKRSNSDSVFIGSSRDRIQMQPDFPENSRLMKMLRNIGKDHPKRLHDDEPFMGMNPMRQSSTSLAIQPAMGGKTDANASKWERAIPVNVGPVLYPPRAGQVVPYAYQALSNRFKDANVGASVISQLAADEGSRTGIEGSGVLSSVNVIAEPSIGKQKSTISIPEPGSSTALGRQSGSTSGSRQMTIFYGGQAHVFDDVHPNKADVIMALAGSNGGSWSTTYSAVKPSGNEPIPARGENDTGMPVHGRLYSSHGVGSSDRMPTLPGGQGRIFMADARQPTRAAAERSTEEKL